MNEYVVVARQIYATGPAANAMLVRDGKVAWLGAHDSPAIAHIPQRLEFSDALVTPAFVDAHVHLSATGAALRSIDLSEFRTAQDALSAVQLFEWAESGLLIGHGWDDTDWPDKDRWTPNAIDQVLPGREVYLSRIDVHSALVSPALLARAGISATGPVRGAEHHRIRELVLARPADLKADIRLALEHAAANGIVSVHECAGPVVSGEADFAAVKEVARSAELPEVVPYWGDLNLTAVRDLGAAGAAGDLFIDGSLGSHTAALSERYADKDTCGVVHIDSRAVQQHLLDCTAIGLQAGFHAIGDTALASVIQGLDAAAAMHGIAAVRQCRHRIEHAEMLDSEMLQALANYGVIASVQPVFDELWADGMYIERLGARARSMNPFAKALATGVVLAFGSDSPVTPIDPWRAVRAAALHRNKEFAISTRAGFAAHTRGGWRAAKQDALGTLEPGGIAHFAVWQTQDVEVHSPLARSWSTDERSGVPGLPIPNAPAPTCLLTARNGRVIYQCS